MNKIKSTFTLAAVVALAAPAAMAATIIIDDFTAPGTAIATLQGNPVEIDVADAGIIGTNRTMWVSTDDNNAPLGTGFTANGSGILDFNNGAADFGQAVLVYDGGVGGAPFSFTFGDLALGVTGAIDVNTAGLGGVDFLMGDSVASRAFTFSGSDFDQGISFATFRAYAWDMDGDLAEYDEFIGGPDFSENLALGAFTVTGGVGDGIFDWTQVGALAFSIESNTPNFDGSLGQISVVPLPASAFLLLGGLGGLAGVSAAKRRRRRKA